MLCACLASPSVGAVHATPERMNAQKIVCAVDFAPADATVLRAGLEAADQLDASMHVVHVTDVVPMATTVDPVHGQVVVQEISSAIDAAEEHMARLLERTETAGIEVTSEVRVGSAAPELVEAAVKQGAGLIVIGTRGRSGLSRLLAGNTAEALVRETPVPVLCVPVPEEEES